MVVSAGIVADLQRVGMLSSLEEFSISMLLHGFQLSCEKSVKYRLIEFFVFDYESLPYFSSRELLFL